MNDINYQHMADQMNFAFGKNFSAEDVRFMIASAVREPVKPYELIEISTDGFGIIQYTVPRKPDRVYRINPPMSSLDMLRRAVSDAVNGKQ